MSRHDFTYFAREGIRNMFSHGFMSFAAIGITVACLVIMGTFSLVAYNAEVQLKNLESEYQILAFINDEYSEAQARALGTQLSAIENVTECTFITRQEAAERYEKLNENESMLQDLDPNIFRDRYAVNVGDLNRLKETAAAVRGVQGVEDLQVNEDIAGGFIMLRNVAGAVCIALIAILLLSLIHI